MSQSNQILGALRKGRSVTALEALMAFNCLRLAARIKELRERGHAITTDMIRKGKKKYASYRLSDKH